MRLRCLPLWGLANSLQCPVCVSAITTPDTCLFFCNQLAKKRKADSLSAELGREQHMDRDGREYLAAKHESLQLQLDSLDESIRTHSRDIALYFVIIKNPKCMYAFTHECT